MKKFIKLTVVYDKKIRFNIDFIINYEKHDMDNGSILILFLGNENKTLWVSETPEEIDKLIESL